ncbi:outer membrane protein A [compost metagenome]
MSPDLMMAVVSAGLAQTAPLPPPPPPKPPLVHGYVYFESGSATPVRRYQIDPIEYLGPRVPTDSFVYVRGQTDTAGSEAFNQALAWKRALAVADLLVLEGVDPRRIIVMSCGERLLNRSTADDTPDPLNRFVLFDWSSEPPRAWASCPMKPYRR